MTEFLPDWTTGAARIVLEDCDACGHRWYFSRVRCPRCGTAEPRRCEVSGNGVVRAVTTVHRAPLSAAGAAPYGIALVDLDEGVRVMGRSAPSVRVDDRVELSFPDPAVLPYFARQVEQS